MEHSAAYTDFVRIMENASGRERLLGIPANVLTDIFDWERDEVEEIIWKAFTEKDDIEMTYYLPRLKNYQPAEEVQKKLAKFNIPSRQNVALAYTMYKLSKNPSFLNIVKVNIMKKKEKTSYVAIVLQDCELEDENIYNLLKDLYVGLTDKFEVSFAEDGLFYYKGIIKTLGSTEEVQNNIELAKKYYSEDIEERKKLIVEFEKEFGN